MSDRKLTYYREDLIIESDKNDVYVNLAAFSNGGTNLAEKRIGEIAKMEDTSSGVIKARLMSGETIVYDSSIIKIG